MAPAPFMTTYEYLRTAETLQPTELIYGALRVADSPAPRHQQAVGAFHLALAPYVRERGLGRVLLSRLDVILDWERALILQPDLLFMSHERWRVRDQKIVAAPDLVLEVLSPQPRIGKLDERIRWFAEYGVREVWLLHQFDEKFEILNMRDGRVAARETLDYLTPIRSGVLPEFRPRVEDILRE